MKKHTHNKKTTSFQPNTTITQLYTHADIYTHTHIHFYCNSIGVGVGVKKNKHKNKYIKHSSKGL